MGCSSTITARLFLENKRMHFGTYINTDAATGGAISTGLHRVDALILIPYGTAVASQPVINGTFPCDDPVTIVTVANQNGLFIVIGV